MSQEWVLAIQLLTAAFFILALLIYVVRKIVCRARLDIGSKAILITGCDSGLGHHLARHLDNLGFHVFAGCLDTSSEGAQRLRQQCSPFLRLVNLNVTQEDHVCHAIRYIAENLPAGEQGLFAVVNNAAVRVCGEFEWQTWAQIQRQMEVNVFGTMRLIKRCLPLLKASQGRIINVSSSAGIHGYPGLSVFSATKHAVEGLCTALRHELKKFGVLVISIRPDGFTKDTNTAFSTLQNANMNEMWAEMEDEACVEYKDYFIKYHNEAAKNTFCYEPAFETASFLPANVIAAFENALINKVPNENYTVMPALHSGFKKFFLHWLPKCFKQTWIGNQYDKVMFPMAQLLRTSSSNLARRSFRSSTNSTVSTELSFFKY